VEGFLVGCFPQIFERHVNVKTHVATPQGKLEIRKENKKL
jgi:hypothetical protein